MIGVISLGLSARLVASVGPRRMVLGGLGADGGRASACWPACPVDGGYVVDVLPAALVLGAGFGLAMPALTGLGMTGATAVRLGGGVRPVLDDPADRRAPSASPCSPRWRPSAPTTAWRPGSPSRRRWPRGTAWPYSVAAGIVLVALGVAAVLLAQPGDQPAAEDAQPKQASAVAG